jgi:SPP1 gp7 family putative phage head morphogenesis protein
MQTLPPLTLKDKYFSAVETEINRIFYELIYRPIVEILGMRKRDIDQEIKNSNDALLEAIANGTIWYDNGQFQGRFNSRTSSAIIKLGGVFNVKAKTWSLPPARLPIDLKFAQTRANDRYEFMRAQILSALDNMDPQNVDLVSHVQEEYEKTLAHMEGDLQKTLPRTPPARTDNPATAVSRITIEAKLTDAQKRVISEDWGNNLDLYIKGWIQENVLKLRQDIQPHVMAGGRAEGLVKVIQDNYGVSMRKAKFLARQETALLMSKFQETRYKDMGVTKYRWSDAHDIRVRHDHHELNGKIFSFDSPPVTNKKTGARNNPGQDFGCRCVAIPVVE